MMTVDLERIFLLDAIPRSLDQDAHELTYENVA